MIMTLLVVDLICFLFFFGNAMHGSYRWAMTWCFSGLVLTVVIGVISAVVGPTA